MVYVAHDQVEAMTMAGQVVLMRDDHVEPDPAPGERYENPTTIVVARFVGLDNYQQMLADPIFWKAMSNNLWFALGTIPLLARARAAHGGLGQ